MSAHVTRGKGNAQAPGDLRQLPLQAGSRAKPRRVTAKVEWYGGALFPRVGFIVARLRRRAEGMACFDNGRGIAAQWIGGCDKLGSFKGPSGECRVNPKGRLENVG